MGDNEALREKIAQAIADPGSRIPRLPGESVPRWTTRAVMPIVEAETEALRQVIADYLLTHVGGDESEPWQAGHNYAMREAARLIREGHDVL